MSVGLSLPAVLFAPMGLGVAVGTMTAPMLARRMRQTTAIAAGLHVTGVVAAAIFAGPAVLFLALRPARRAGPLPERRSRVLNVQ